MLPIGLVAKPVAAADHWAFQPLRARFDHQDVDGFIGAKLKEHGLASSPVADRRTLIRRATFDLTGLPPSHAEVEAFVNDTSPDAYARLVDRLLASPHYGEQWARHWLDVARYSDTKGYVYAREEKLWVHASPYRDWVARALNEDMPYDRFVSLQIAADQLVPAGSPDLVAMGFLTLGRRFLGVTHDIIDDRIDVVTRGMLGLTVACARCHDHKFDPIPTRDYYALYGVFQSSAEKVVPCAAGEDARLTELVQKNLDLMTKRREEQMARTRATVREHLEAQLSLDKYPEEVFGQILDAKDLNPYIVRRWQSYLEKCREKKDPVFAVWHAFAKIPASQFAHHAREVWTRLHSAPAGTVHPRIIQAFTQPPADMREVARRYGEVLASADDDEALRRVLHGNDSPCHVPDEHIANNEMYFPTNVVVELWKSQGDVDRHLIKTDGSPSHATILLDRPQPATPRVFTRGNPLTKAEEVPRQFLSAISQVAQGPFVRGSGRLELAQAIANPRNPLTARVMVNRLWQHHFGRGIVSTPSDFGKQGGAPSHPELLDWLAARFLQSGWSMKAMHRLIMLSRTYQQQSREQGAAGRDPDSSPAPKALLAAREADPDNRLLWRMNSHRLRFEEARDAWLAAAGRLDLRIGGRPAALFASGNTRRTLYALVDREALPGVMRTFDFANPDLSIPARNETTVPQQALFGMNHPFVVSQAKALLKRADVAGCESDAARVRRMYGVLYQREPSHEELAFAFEFVHATEAPPFAGPPPSQSWQYGYGEWDEAAGRLKSFTPLPHFTGSAWQGAERWPNDELGWAQLTAGGGHPGNDRKHAVVRRWVAPAEGEYDVRSTLMHEPAAGDGIRAFVSHSGRGKLHGLKLHHSSADLNLDAIHFKAGDTLDFIVDIGDGLNSDQFLWAPRITLGATTGAGGDSARHGWDAGQDFAAQLRSQLNAWEQFAQVLMLANEFMFVD